MKFKFSEYWKDKYCIFTKCGYRVTKITHYSDPRDQHLTCTIVNDKGESNIFIYDLDGNMDFLCARPGIAAWNVSRDDLELVMYECEKKWFNVRVGISGVLDSSRSYDSESEAMKYRLLSDTDTVCVITKIFNDYGKEGQIEEI